MYKLDLADPENFLTKYWQKKPLVIRNAFDNFIDPLDEHELAGLAQEDVIDSRIIAQQNGNWSVEQGPIDDFSQHCIGAWSLLVQGVDQYIPEANELLDAFDFIPKWRVEDLMVSYSMQNAGVGPHLDQYDVFIVQGKGSRRWQVGKKEDKTTPYQTVLSHSKLCQIEVFDPIIDEVLMPGDMIYIPPGFPHNGVANEPCLNYSIGFRAPNQLDIIHGLADYAELTDFQGERFTDKDRKLTSQRHSLQRHDIIKFKELLIELAESTEFESFLGSYLSASPLSDKEQTDSPEAFNLGELKEMLQKGAQLEKSLEANCLLMDGNDNRWRLFANSKLIETNVTSPECVNALLNLPIVTHSNLTDLCESYQVSKYDLWVVLQKLITEEVWLFSELKFD